VDQDELRGEVRKRKHRILESIQETRQEKASIKISGKTLLRTLSQRGSVIRNCREDRGDGEVVGSARRGNQSQTPKGSVGTTSSCLFPRFRQSIWRKKTVDGIRNPIGEEKRKPSKRAKS